MGRPAPFRKTNRDGARVRARIYLPVKPTSLKDTIVAGATPPGVGAIAIVRLSGDRAVAAVAEVFASASGRDIRTDRRRIFHGEIRDGDGAVDEVLVHVMRAPHSYTGEDVVEINCHGGPGPTQAIIELLLARGARGVRGARDVRLAEPGEFTRRAFLNGRLDLVQAEAVIDRIQAQTSASLRAATSSARGTLSAAIREMRETLADALARVEAAVDFPEEDLPDLVDDALRRRLEQTHAHMRELLATSRVGRLYREGAAVAIAGRPNVGKSSLFNALVREARAIVTEHPGTTRDRIEEVITIRGVPVRLSDTAGLRAAQDEVEQIGVEVARNALKSADVVLYVEDAAQPRTAEDEALANEGSALGAQVLRVLNKIDLVPDAPFPAGVRVSAKTGQGIGELEDRLGRLLLGDDLMSPDQALVTRIHQRDSLERAAASLGGLLDRFDASPEFLSMDLRESLDALGEITGETTSDDVLDRIFSTFCIGK